VSALVDAGMGPITVSTNTATGKARGHALMPYGVTIVYLAVDRPAPVERFLERLSPCAAFILETELWPHLIGSLHRQNIPVALVNARLSERSLKAPRWWQRTAAWCLVHTNAILARSETDRAAFARLGASRARVHLVGNLKNAAPIGPTPEPIELGRRFVLAASTHDDEEQQIARALGADTCQNVLWVIAPRHPARGPAIRRKLNTLGWHVAQRSLGESVPGVRAIYLADTLGELPGLMRASELVVMGGSLIPHGGQNVLEAARAGRPVVTGPHMENFAGETESLHEAGALVQAKNAEELIAWVEVLLADTGKRRTMAEAASAWLARQTDPAALYLHALEDLVHTVESDR
jgi:3-deoxy-D-manno-octulosonic-acid transferase